jgi:hypothetical protein
MNSFLGQVLVEHVELALHLHGEAVDRYSIFIGA